MFRGVYCRVLTDTDSIRILLDEREIRNWWLQSVTDGVDSHRLWRAPHPRTWAEIGQLAVVARDTANKSTADFPSGLDRSRRQGF